MSLFSIKIPDKHVFSRYTFGFHSRRQMDFFMIIREDWVNGEVVWADIVFGTNSIIRNLKSWQIKFHDIDRYFTYPRANRWDNRNGEIHHQIGWGFNIDIIKRYQYK
jgi:hypothetical protein